MRKSLLLYFSVFMVLVVVFQYVSANKMVKSKEQQIEALKGDVEELTENYNAAVSEKKDSETFSLSGNDAALSYFEERGYDPSKVSQLVEDHIIGMNKASEDNDLVPYEGMEGFMRINKIKILNHKWIIASFTDGTYWGEIFLTYLIDGENILTLQTEKSFLYPLN